MKKTFVVFIAILSLISCNNTKRIVSDIPIKTNVLGVELCERMTFEQVAEVLAKNTNLYFMPVPMSQQGGGSVVYRLMPEGLNFQYGGLSWTYIDVNVTKDSEVCSISLVGSYESIENAKRQYDSAVSIFAKKYGKWNKVEGESESIAYWTDDVNSVGVGYAESSTLNGADRSFCELYYVNIALSDKVEEENQQDI